MKKHKYFIIDENRTINNLTKYLKEINQPFQIIDILKLHGLGFYRRYEIDIMKEDKNPEWFQKFSNGIFNTLIINNFHKISFNSTGYQLIKDIIDNNVIKIYDEKDKVIKTINFEPNNELSLILIVNNNFIQLQKYIENLEKYKKYYLKNIENIII